MHVKDLASKFDVPPDTIRYYLRIGLIKPIKNTANGYHDFSIKDANRISFILASRELGFSISDIKKILSESDKGNSPCAIVKSLIRVRLEETEKKFNEMSALRKKMTEAIVEWEEKPELFPDGESICHLIEKFADSAE